MAARCPVSRRMSDTCFRWLCPPLPFDALGWDASAGGARAHAGQRARRAVARRALCRAGLSEQAIDRERYGGTGAEEQTLAPSHHPRHRRGGIACRSRHRAVEAADPRQGRLRHCTWSRTHRHDRDAPEPGFQPIRPADLGRSRRGPAMTADVDTAMPRSTDASEPIPAPVAGRRWKKLRSMAIVLATQVAILAAFLGFWDYMTSQNRAAAFMFGSPSAIAGFLGQMARDGSLWRDSYVTGSETLLGFFAGNLVGTVIGLSLWYSRFVSRVVEPFVIAVGSIPIIALAPIIIIWFGTGLISKVAMSTLSVVIVAFVTSYKGAVGFALIGAIVGEFMSSSEGLGHAIFKAGSLYVIPKVFAALVATIALALILTFIVGKIERLLMPWRRNL